MFPMRMADHPPISEAQSSEETCFVSYTTCTLLFRLSRHLLLCRLGLRRRSPRLLPSTSASARLRPLASRPVRTSSQHTARACDTKLPSSLELHNSRSAGVLCTPSYSLVCDLSENLLSSLSRWLFAGWWPQSSGTLRS